MGRVKVQKLGRVKVVAQSVRHVKTSLQLARPQMEKQYPATPQLGGHRYRFRMQYMFSSSNCLFVRGALPFIQGNNVEQCQLLVECRYLLIPPFLSWFPMMLSGTPSITNHVIFLIWKMKINVTFSLWKASVTSMCLLWGQRQEILNRVKPNWPPLLHYKVNFWIGLCNWTTKAKKVSKKLLS